MTNHKSGIILDGNIKVGTFTLMDENNLDKDTFFNVKINKNYFNLALGKSNNLYFKITEEISENKYLQVEDCGYGCIDLSLGIWDNGQEISINKANFRKLADNKFLSTMN